MSKSEPTIRIDVGGVGSRVQLQELLATKLGFPGYYGENWDAFDECVREFRPSGSLTVSGIEALRSVLPREARLFEQALKEYEMEAPSDRNVSIR